MDKLSVIITCYNDGKLLKRAFQSLERQTDRDFETIIVNDGSRDEVTNKICLELEQEKGVQVIWHKENHGVSAARNSGCRAMKGNIYVPLDADDILPQGAIAAIRDGFRRFPEADFVFGNYIHREVENNHEKLIDCGPLCTPDGFLDPAELTHKWILYGGSPWRKSLWRQIGGYAEDVLSGSEDMDFWMRALVLDAKGVYVNHTIYEWNKSKAGANSNVPKEEWLKLFTKNIVFYDMFGNGVKTRLSFICKYLLLGKFKEAQELIRLLIKLR